VICLPFNDFEAVEKAVKDNYGDLAAIMVEPVLGNIAGIEPKKGFLDHLRKLCDEYGVVLIFDEVKTGFRLANGGAQEYYNVRADIATYAKSLGNGFPVAAFGGKAEVMDVIGSGTSHGGTYTANTVAMAAADAVTRLLVEEPVLDTMAKRGQRLKSGLDEIMNDVGIPHIMTGHPNMQGFIIAEGEGVYEFRDIGNHDADMYEKLLENLAELGVWPEADAREPWFLCYDHDDAIIDETLNKFEDAAKKTIGK
jgi:glutamate-1-semialdehyde 2,1-aminomutase